MGVHHFASVIRVETERVQAVMYVKRFKGWGLRFVLKILNLFWMDVSYGCFVGVFWFCAARMAQWGVGSRHGIGVVKPSAWQSKRRLECVSGQVFFRKLRREASESKFSAPWKGMSRGVTLSEELQSKFWIWTLLKRESWRNCTVRNGFATDRGDMPSCPGSRDLFWARRLCLFL